MSERAPISLEALRSSDGTPRHVDYATLPPDVVARPEGIQFQHNTFVVSVATMVLISLITFFIPLFNGLLGGAFGGYHAGRMKRALGAALVTSVLVPAIILGAYALAGPHLSRLFSGLGTGGWIALHVMGTFLGAASGAASRPLDTERDLYRPPLRPL
ncbi:hypothetical protein POL68_30295 [Stigmatella sp. ncwal1]|uniref:Uncharacterized protein n=1 Tax=Stigmatella ashevillensis TaxID=2995309 RepID=A0ABT5DI25_9BACT|nr:hypothetical protein [Stigmatella ashevillena]MDC0712790.1 hypothetical protein [Stigmatella ashevillena]